MEIMDSCIAVREIPNYNGNYLIDELGRVWNNRGKLLNIQLGSHDYLQCCLYLNNKRKVWRIHLLMKQVFFPSGKYELDHADTNKHNNSLANLRIATHGQNSMNRSPILHKSRFKGVTPKRGHWMARVKFNGKYTYLGEFTSEEDAAKAYDKKARELFGEFAFLNFSEE